MSSEIAIAVDRLSKCYQIYSQPHDRLKQSLYPRLQRLTDQPAKQYFREFWALNDVSFEIRKGETVGIVGKNGSGKSTLLQLICGTLNPTGGSVRCNGRIAALLELGSGFNPEFTGRENVYMNTAVLGLDRAETDARLDGILAFADIGDFVDQPVKTYSSGMLVRLAFAVAVNVEPQILIVDEALSVGDELFQRKCFARIESIKKNGATILFVSHSASAVVELCDRALLLDGGRLLMDSDPRSVIKQYHRLIFSKGGGQAPPAIASDTPATTDKSAPAPIDAGVAEYVEGLAATAPMRYDSCGGRIVRFDFCDRNGNSANLISAGLAGSVRLSVQFDRPFQDVVFGFHLKSVSGLEVAGLGYPAPQDALIAVASGETVEVSWDVDMLLTPGIYFFTFGVRSVGEGGFIDRIVDAAAIKIVADTNSAAFGLFDISRDQARLDRRKNNE